ncbi:GNAT family N-acetyltransferase [Alisedimentitalea sp. MJ-SS2]|uniref:GNAT family N-acetyltransferase n=1 Tax=Aliisedimentitalea sp. MJ-SS2 TaxID=3049795 RepID=UPI00290A88AE|nr:GNAT family N-acetyltransferase [Alisedimentitalea sp. MJ-SS2]MDU8928654.1 GNAT family N-acetyltransferase [Alisedimentitalea sp. MJ-SS2]
MKIAPATSAHVAALARIRGDWARETPWIPVLHSRDDDLKFVTHLAEKVQVFVTDPAPPTGFISVDNDAVPALYVAPGARSQGIGTALLDRARDGRDHLRLWCFQTNPGARCFYAREGFTEIDRTDGDNEEGLPDVQFAWERGRA